MQFRSLCISRHVFSWLEGTAQEVFSVIGKILLELIGHCILHFHTLHYGAWSVGRVLLARAGLWSCLRKCLPAKLNPFSKVHETPLRSFTGMQPADCRSCTYARSMLSVSLLEQDTPNGVLQSYSNCITIQVKKNKVKIHLTLYQQTQSKGKSETKETTTVEQQEKLSDQAFRSAAKPLQ